MITSYQQGDLVHMLHNSKAGKRKPMYMAHGCNCKHVMGAGIAGALRAFPEVFNADCNTQSTLGEYSVAAIGSRDVAKPPSFVFNLYTQFSFGSGRQLNYAALAKCFLSLNEVMRTKEEPVYIPCIGAGLAGGEWSLIELIINDATPDVDIIVIDYAEGIDPRNL